MSLLRYLLRTSRTVVLVIIAASLVGGACSTGLLVFINQALHNHGRSLALLAAGFAALGLSKVLAGLLSDLLLVRFAEGTVKRLRTDLVKKILAVPLRKLEDIGTPRIMATFTDDVSTLTNAFLLIPYVATNVAMLAGGGVYLAWLSWKVLLASLIFIVAGILVYRLLMIRSKRSLKAAREEEDRLFSHFEALTLGIKELKLHLDRRRAFLDKSLKNVIDAYERHCVVAETRYSLAQAATQFFLYALIGLIVFAMPELASSGSETLTGYVITIVFLMGPMQAVLSVLPRITRAEVAFRKIEDLGLSLAKMPVEFSKNIASKEPGAWRSIELRGVTHSYHREKEDDHFQLGPIDLSFHPGEIVFLVGGNGSGKTTLAKIVTGLYPPETGDLFLDGREVSDENRDDFRQLFSAVFSDFYLFETLLGLDAPELDARAKKHLTELHLNHKVQVQDGRLSTTALSFGQRKRLALLTAYLEDRPFCVFDEWASGQDPEFKDIFYNRILPELKARAKTVLVISHDDRYFHVADRRIWMEEGKLRSDESGRQAAAALSPQSR